MANVRNDDEIIRAIPLEEVRNSDCYWELADLSEIFHHEIIEDNNNVWRWRKNKFFCLVLDDAPWYQGEWGANARVVRGHLSLNDIWMDFYGGKYTLEELVKFYMGIGYSLSGFFEVFGQRNIFELPALPEGYEDVEEDDNAPTLIEFLREIHTDKVLWNL